MNAATAGLGGPTTDHASALDAFAAAVAAGSPVDAAAVAARLGPVTSLAPFAAGDVLVEQHAAATDVLVLVEGSVTYTHVVSETIHETITIEQVPWLPDRLEWPEHQAPSGDGNGRERRTAAQPAVHRVGRAAGAPTRRCGQRSSSSRCDGGALAVGRAGSRGAGDGHGNEPGLTPSGRRDGP